MFCVIVRNLIRRSDRCSSRRFGATVDQVASEGVDDPVDLDVPVWLPVGHKLAQVRAPGVDERRVRCAG